MEEKDFKIGDVVFLNSGSPQMTISKISDDKTVADVTYWNTVSNQFEERTFSTEIISVVQYSEVL